MKNLFYLSLIFLLTTNLIHAQISTETDSNPGMSKFNLHAEASTFIFASSVSINIEPKFFSSDSEKFHLYGRAGFGYADVGNFILCSGQDSFGGILGITILTGKGDHHFEINGGTFLGSFKNKINDRILTGSCRESGFRVIPLFDLGYRYQKPGSGIFFRAKFGIHGLGVGLGYAF